MTYLTDPETGRQYVFSCVTSVTHSLTVKLNTDSNASLAAQAVLSAVNEPDRITLTVVCSDTDAEPARLFAELRALKERFARLTLVSPVETLTDLMLTEVTAAADEKAPNGWTGTVVLRHAAYADPGTGSAPGMQAGTSAAYAPPAAPAAETGISSGANTSTPVGKGNAVKKTTTAEKLVRTGLQVNTAGRFRVL